MTKYQFRSGARTGSLKPEIAARELKRLARGGHLYPAEVVEAARPDGAPLHPAFEWDDSVAAEEYRLNQARRLIRAVVEVRPGEEPRAVYAYIPSQENGYETIDALVKHQDRFTLALSSALQDLASAQQRVDELKRAAGEQPDRLAVITLAAQALQTAAQAIRTLH